MLSHTHTHTHTEYSLYLAYIVELTGFNLFCSIPNLVRKFIYLVIFTKSLSKLNILQILFIILATYTYFELGYPLKELDLLWTMAGCSQWKPSLLLIASDDSHCLCWFVFHHLCWLRLAADDGGIPHVGCR